MTGAQRAALEVLATADGKPVGGWKRRTKAEDRPRVNYNAAAGLVRLGFARFHVGRHSPYGHSDTYSITDAGRAELERATS